MIKAINLFILLSSIFLFVVPQTSCAQCYGQGMYDSGPPENTLSQKMIAKKFVKESKDYKTSIAKKLLKGNVSNKLYILLSVIFLLMILSAMIPWTTFKSYYLLLPMVIVLVWGEIECVKMFGGSFPLSNFQNWFLIIGLLFLGGRFDFAIKKIGIHWFYPLIFVALLSFNGLLFDIIGFPVSMKASAVISGGLNIASVITENNLISGFGITRIISFIVALLLFSYCLVLIKPRIYLNTHKEEEIEYSQKYLKNLSDKQGKIVSLIMWMLLTIFCSMKIAIFVAIFICGSLIKDALGTKVNFSNNRLLLNIFMGGLIIYLLKDQSINNLFVVETFKISFINIFALFIIYANLFIIAELIDKIIKKRNTFFILWCFHPLFCMIFMKDKDKEILFSKNPGLKHQFHDVFFWGCVTMIIMTF